MQAEVSSGLKADGSIGGSTNGPALNEIDKSIFGHRAGFFVHMPFVQSSPLVSVLPYLMFKHIPRAYQNGEPTWTLMKMPLETYLRRA
jgi:hypothetical protein